MVEGPTKDMVLKETIFDSSHSFVSTFKLLHWTKFSSGFSITSYRKTQTNFLDNPIYSKSFLSHCIRQRHTTIVSYMDYNMTS